MKKEIQPKLTVVGAGPGDVDLITVKAINALSEANVILYDAIVNRELFKYAPIDAIKIHQLLVLEKTKIAKEHEDGFIKPIELNEYISLVCDFLEILPPNVVIHRLFAEAKPGELIAPKWAEQDDGRRNKQQLLQMIKNELLKRGSKQSKKYLKFPI